MCPKAQQHTRKRLFVSVLRNVMSCVVVIADLILSCLVTPLPSLADNCPRVIVEEELPNSPLICQGRCQSLKTHLFYVAGSVTTTKREAAYHNQRWEIGWVFVIDQQLVRNRITVCNYSIVNTSFLCSCPNCHSYQKRKSHLPKKLQRFFGTLTHHILRRLQGKH